MSTNMEQKDFQVQPIQSKEREMTRAECVRLEMASAVRLLGGEAISAKEAVNAAARKTGLSVRLVERLRYRKIIRIAADVADTIREAIAAQQAKQDAQFRHEVAVLLARCQALESRVGPADADVDSREVDANVEPTSAAVHMARSRDSGDEQ